MPQLPKPSRTSVGISMMVTVIVVLIAGTVMVARRDNTTQVATRSGPSPSTVAVQVEAPADTLIARPQSTTNTANPGTTTIPASSVEAPQTTAGAPATSSAPKPAAAVVESSVATSPSSSQTTIAVVDATTTTSDLDSQGTTNTSSSAPTVPTAPVDSTTSTSPAAQSTTTTTSATTTSATTEYQAPAVPNPLTTDVSSGTYTMPTSGSITLILPKGTADPSISGQLLVIGIDSLVDTNDERWELRSNGAGISTVTARTATATFVWTIVTPAPGY